MKKLAIFCCVIACMFVFAKENKQSQVKYVFEHEYMKKFSKDPQRDENQKRYLDYLDQLMPIKADCYLGIGNGEYKMIRVQKRPEVVLVLDSDMEISSSLQKGERFFAVYTAIDTLSSGGILPRVNIMSPECFVSKDVWDCIIAHELAHVRSKDTDMYIKEIKAYLEESHILKHKNKVVFNYFLENGIKIYQKKGFSSELENFCIETFQTEKLSPLERSLIEADLMIIVAMNHHKVDSIDSVESMKNVLMQYQLFIAKI